METKEDALEYLNLKIWNMLILGKLREVTDSE